MTFRMLVISVLVLGTLGAWLTTDEAKYNCHCYAWHAETCRCHDSELPKHVIAVDPEDVRLGDMVTYSYGPNGNINHSAVYVGNGWAKGKLGAFPVIWHPLCFAFPYGTHYQVWRFEPDYQRKWEAECDTLAENSVSAKPLLATSTH